MKSYKEEVVGFFQRHLVPVFFTFTKADKSYNAVISTFVLSVSEQWLLITAGHCIEQIRKNTFDCGYKITKCLLIDSCGLDAKHYEPIPFNYETSYPISLSKNLGFDFGLIPLTPNYRRLLEKNEIKALNEDVWKHQPSKVDFYMLLGVPQELTKVTSENIEITTTLHRIEPLDKPPNGFEETNVPRFYGRINLSESLTSIKGMSGGPIFAFRQDEKGHLRYWLFALQSRWLPSSQIIAACPTKVLGLFIQEIMARKHNDLCNKKDG